MHLPIVLLLAVDFTIVEPMGVSAMRGSDAAVAGACALAARRKKVARYAALIRDPSRLRLVPWALEAWGRHDEELEDFLRATARVAAETQPGRLTSGDDAADERRDRRVAAGIYSGWRATLSAGVAVATARHLDRTFHPVGGTAALQGLQRFVARVPGRVVDDEGVFGVSGRARNPEPRFSSLGI